MNKHPVVLNPKQKFIAKLLAAGASIDEAAKASGVSSRHITVWMKGSLFPLEVDEARDKIVGKRIKQFNNVIADELLNNVNVLRDIRDNPQAKHADRLRAIEILTDRIVPRPVAEKNTNTTQVKVVLTGDKEQKVRDALDEAIDVTPDSEEEE